MFSALFWFALGLLVGWNFLSQPEWIRVRVEAFENWLKGLFNGS